MQECFEPYAKYILECGFEDPRGICYDLNYKATQEKLQKFVDLVKLAHADVGAAATLSHNAARTVAAGVVLLVVAWLGNAQ